MGILTNKVKKDDIKAGDHIYTYRAAFTYSHHGIFVGSNKVVHFTPKLTESSSTQASRFTFSGMSNISASCSSTQASRFTFSGMSNISASCPTSGVSESSLSCPTSGMSSISASCPTSGMSKSFSCPTSGMSNISASCPTSDMSNILVSCPTSVMSESFSCPTSGMSNISASCPTSGLSNISVSYPTSYPDCGFRQLDSGVVITCLDCFLQNGSPYRFEYGVGSTFLLTRVRGGTCTTAASDPPQTVIHRAMYLLQNGFGNYSVLENNCEDFALYCRTGLLKGGGSSGQASNFVGVTLSSSVSYIAKYLLAASPVGVATVTVGMYCMNRYATDIGVRTDVTKVSVEDLAVKPVGLDSNEGLKENKASD